MRINILSTAEHDLEEDYRFYEAQATCAHGCAYCYATFNQTVVAKNKKLHYSHSPFLVGGSEDYLDAQPEIDQRSLF